jgi:hypothetical protein
MDISRPPNKKENTNMYYNVVFEYTEKAGVYKGVRTIKSFESKDHFDKWYSDEIRENETVVEPGVSDKQGMELCSQTPLSTRLRVALHESTNDETGEVNETKLKMFMFNLIAIGEI